MRRTRRSGGKPPGKSPEKNSAERIKNAKKHIQRRRGTRVATNAARIGAERMAVAEEAAQRQAIADAEAEAQRAAERALVAAEEAQRAAARAAELRQLPNVSFKMQVRPVPEFLRERNQQLQSQLRQQAEHRRQQEELMNQGFKRQEQFAMSFL